MKGRVVRNGVAAELRAAYRSGELTPVEVVESCLAMIETTQPILNAFVLVEADAAREAARASRDRWRRGVPLGLGDGIPVAIKDLFLTMGQPTLRGSFTINADQPWTENAPVVDRLQSAGAIRIGKTTMPEHGWKGVTDSPRHGVTRNPLDPTLTPGGSSGGSAVAVATGSAVWALGSDGGGSIRIPAAFAGICGFKPTHGVVPYYPPSPFGLLSHVGPMARTVSDLAEMMELLAGPDPRDPTSAPMVGTGFADVSRSLLDPPRIALWMDDPVTDPQVSQTVVAAIERWAIAGAHVDIISRPFPDPYEAWSTLWLSGTAALIEGMTAAQRQRMDPGLLACADMGRSFRAADYVRALGVRSEVGLRVNEIFRDADLLVTPTTAIPPFLAGRNTPTDWPSSDWATWSPYTYPFNLTHHPALSIPCGSVADGRPVGIQLVSPRHTDAELLGYGRQLEALLSLKTPAESSLIKQ